MDFYKLVTTISEARLSWGTFVWVLIFLTSAYVAFKKGKGWVIVKIMAVFMALVLSSNLPFLDFALKGVKLGHSLARIIVFTISFGVISFFLGKTSLALIEKSKGSLINTLVLALVFSGLLASVVTNLLPSEIQNELGQKTDLILAEKPAGFIWVLITIIFILIIG